jgi:hypothetical protein
MKTALASTATFLLVALNAPMVDADPPTPAGGVCPHVLESMSFGSLQPVLGIQEVLNALGDLDPNANIAKDLPGSYDGFVLRDQPYEEVAFYHFEGVSVDETYVYWVTGFDESPQCVSEVMRFVYCLLDLLPFSLGEVSSFGLIDDETEGALHNATNSILPPWSDTIVYVPPCIL